MLIYLINMGMKKPQRPFAARIPFDDKTRLAIAQTLDGREDLDLSWISRNVLGRNHAYLFQYLFKRTPRMLDYADAIKLANFLDIETSIFSTSLQTPSKLSEPFHQNISHTSGETVPIRGPMNNSNEALQMHEGQDIGRAARHPAQKGMKGGFAFYAVGESMAPRYRPGELVYAVTNKPPVHGQDCVVELVTGEGYLKEFDRQTDKAVLCKQLNPGSEWKQSIASIKALHAVVGRG
jgi:Peptidase S24-like